MNTDPRLVSHTYIKNWEPLVPFPRLAIDNKNGLSCFSWKFSSAKSNRKMSIRSTIHHIKPKKIFRFNFTIKCSSVYTFTTSAVVGRKVTRLNHKIFDHSMENYTLWCNKTRSVLRSPGHLILKNFIHSIPYNVTVSLLFCQYPFRRCTALGNFQPFSELCPDKARILRVQPVGHQDLCRRSIVCELEARPLHPRSFYNNRKQEHSIAILLSQMCV